MAAHQKKPMLEFSADLELPIDAVTQTFAFIARRGAGKTYGATKLAEGMLDAGAQTVAIDPVGVWWGLRVAADGKGKGFAIPVFGGLHGDVPLEPGAGALIADLIVDKGISAVLDVSMFRKGDRKKFVTDFAEQLFHRKKSARSPLHVFVEEAQVFVPQRVQADEARMLGAFEDIIKLGRNFGIGATLITQRPQAVNKDALNQTECLVVLQTNGAQERKALKDWVVEQGVDVNLLAELPSLSVGVAWLWSPQWLQTLKKVHIAKKRTFNASATPEVGAVERAPRELAPVDLEQIRVAMKDVVTRAQEADPKALRKRIAELEAQMKRTPAAAPPPAPVSVPVLSEDDRKALDLLVAAVSDHMRIAAATVEEMAKTFRDLTAKVRGASGLSARGPEATRQSHQSIHRPAPARAVPSPRAEPAVVGEVKLVGRSKMMLQVLAQFARPMTRNQLAVWVGMAAGTGGFNNYVSALKGAGLLTDARGEVELTDAGRAAAAELGAAPVNGSEVIETWKQKLVGKGKAIFAELVQAYPDTLSRDELADRVGMEPGTGGFNNYISTMTTAGIVEKDGPGFLRAAALLFD